MAEDRGNGKQRGGPDLLFAAVAVASLASAGARLAAASSAEFVARFPHDDAFYYFQIARNLARGLGPTFDGVNWTNGFQPLWGALLVPIFGLVRDGELAARIACFVSVLLFVVGIDVLRTCLARVFGAWPAALAATGAVLSVELLETCLRGMDFALDLLLQAVLLRAFQSLHGRSARRAELLAFGAFAGLLFVERPDASLVGALLGLALLRRAGARGFLPLALGAVLVAVPYLVGNQLVFGSALPISGKVKVGVALAELELHGFAKCWDTLARTALGPPLAPLLALLGGPLTTVLHVGTLWRGALLGVLVAGCALSRARHARAQAPELTAIHVSALVHALLVAVLLFPHAAYGDWYFSPEIVAGTALSAGALAGIGQLLSVSLRRAMGTLLVLLASGAHAYGFRQAWNAPPPSPTSLEVTALAVAEHLRALGPGARIGSFNAGRLGFYTDGMVVNLDGLVNTAEYAERVIAPGSSVRWNLQAYLVTEKIEWIADVVPRMSTDRIRALLPPPTRPFVHVEETWPVDRVFSLERPGVYALVRFDVEAALRAVEEEE